MKFRRLGIYGLIGTMLIGLAACGNDAANVSGNEAEDTNPGSGAVASAETDVTEVPEIEGYNLIWNDEFNGNTLDESIWSYDPHEPGWTNNELQEYTTSTDNVFVKDGNLVLKAIKSDNNGSDYYTSGKIKSQGKQDFMYGKVVVRAKVPEGKGLWPAIWMMPTDESYYGQWPKCGEIDIMEVLCNDVTTSYSTIHYGEPHAEQQGIITLDSGSFASDFHEYSVEWEPGEMRFYTDDVLVLTVNDWFSAEAGQEDKEYPAPFNQNFFVQLNLAVGGTWPGNPDATTNFDNAEFLIDYVRVYQKPEYDTNVTKPEAVFREALEDGNFVYNGDFADAEDLSDEANWRFFNLENGAGEANISDGMITISTTNDGDQEYSIQLVQAEMPILKNHSYRFSFDIKADAQRDAVVCISAPTAGWIRYFADTTIDITTEWQTYTFEFTSSEKDDNNGRVEFNMGNHGYTDTIYITNVRVEDITE